MTRQSLVDSLTQYTTTYQEEHEFISRFLTLLQSEHCYFRDHLPGHITASGWIVSHDLKKVLLVHHAKLNKWLQPGGHADGDENTLAVAQKEVLEETGLLVQGESTFFDIDIHGIPARGDFPEHDHYDVRYLFRASEDAPLTINHESQELKWVPLDELERYNASSSVVRMKQKLLRRN